MVLTFGILGPLEVRDGDRVIPLPRRKHRALLAFLLLRAGDTVSSDTLIEQLWGERPPRTAKDALVNYISLLRKALGPDVLLTRDPGYALKVSPEQTDLGRFERLAAEARATESAGERADKLREALALWRDSPFADMAFEPFAQLETARLDELRLVAEQDLTDAELALGRHTEVIPQLETLIQQHPYDERLRGQLMLALYRSGRQADALEAFQKTRGLLVDELGIEPGPELKQLEAAILRQDASLAAPSAPVAAVQAARKTVTVLFADLVESSELAERLDPEALQAVLARHFVAMREAVERHGGTVEKFIGDAAMAVFGTPTSHEDDALRAVRAAVEIRDVLRVLEDGLEARIGVNTGEVFSGGGDVLVTGSAVNLAKRLEQAAPAGEILVGAATLRLVRDAVKAEPVEPLRRGDAEPVLSFRVLDVTAGVPGLARRFDLPLVGREQELAQLRKAWGQVQRKQHCRVVTLQGEAGIGKTRLAQELISSVGDEGTVLVGRCVSYGEGATYLPLTEMIDNLGALIANLTSTEEIALAVRKRFEKISQKRPLLLVFEDVHWAEATLLDLIAYLGQRAKGSILCVCLARPGFEEERPPGDEIVSLEPLPDQQVEALVDSLDADLTSALRTRIVEIAEGNPLFAEQLIAYSREEGVERLDTVPPSIEAVLASRLDRLDLDGKALLGRAAVAGREFTRQAVGALGPVESLPSLELAGLVHGTGDLCRFHHVLIRDVAYAALPKAERADLHERYAFWLEEQPTGSDEIIGYHLEQAHSCLTALGQAGNRRYELGVRTSERLAAAGRVALDREDVRAAANLLARALALDEGGASVSLRLDLADALENSGQLEEAIAKATEAADRALACGDDAGAFRARLHAAGIALSQTWDSTSVASLLKLVEEAECVFEDAGDDRGLADASRITVAAEMERCRYGAGIAVLNKAADHARRAGELRQERHILAEIGDAHLYGPTPVRDALAWLDEQGSAFNRNPQIVLTRATLQAMLGEFDDARRLVAVSSAQLAELGMHSGRGVHKRWYVETLAGDHAAAEAEARRVSEMLEQMGARAHRSTVTCELAWSLCALGRDKEAETTVALGEELSASEDVINQVFLRQVRARLLVRAGRRDLAEDMAREAVAMVEKTDVLGAHGDALIDLADVLCLGDGAERAIPVVETALQLYEAKGTLVMARRARALLDQLHETA